VEDVGALVIARRQHLRPAIFRINAQCAEGVPEDGAKSKVSLEH
jgi:hypothetical protein